MRRSSIIPAVAFLLSIALVAGCDIAGSSAKTSSASTGKSPTAAVSPTQNPETNASIYDRAVEALKDNRKVVAYSLFSRSGDYKDSAQQAKDLRYVLYYYPVFQDTGANRILYLKNDGSVAQSQESSRIYDRIVNQWTTAVSFSDGDYNFKIALKADGTILSYANEDDVHRYNETVAEISKWTRIVQVLYINESMIHGVCAGLRDDGTVLVTESGISGSENVKPTEESYADAREWTDIIQINFFRGILFGLKSDGTVVASEKPLEKLTKDDPMIVVNRSDWNNVVMLTGKCMLKRNGTVVTLMATDSFRPSEKWTDIVAIFRSQNTYYSINEYFALRSDGLIINQYGMEFDGYRNAVYIRKDKISESTFFVILNDGSVKIGSAAILATGEAVPGFLNAKDILIPAGRGDKPFLSDTDADKRFDAKSISYFKTLTYPYLNGKYSVIIKHTGSAECGYDSRTVGLTDKDGNVIFEPSQYTAIMPVTDERFVLAVQSPITAAAFAFVADRSGNRISEVNFKWVYYTHNDKLYNVGIGMINYPPPSTPPYLLVDTDGKSINDIGYDSLEFNDNDTIKAVINKVEYTLDLTGKIIP